MEWQEATSKEDSGINGAEAEWTTKGAVIRVMSFLLCITSVTFYHSSHNFRHFLLNLLSSESFFINPAQQIEFSHPCQSR